MGKVGETLLKSCKDLLDKNVISTEQYNQCLDTMEGGNEVRKIELTEKKIFGSSRDDKERKYRAFLKSIKTVYDEIYRKLREFDVPAAAGGAVDTDAAATPAAATDDATAKRNDYDATLVNITYTQDKIESYKQKLKMVEEKIDYVNTILGFDNPSIQNLSNAKLAANRGLYESGLINKIKISLLGNGKILSLATVKVLDNDGSNLIKKNSNGLYNGTASQSTVHEDNNAGNALNSDIIKITQTGVDDPKPSWSFKWNEPIHLTDIYRIQIYIPDGNPQQIKGAKIELLYSDSLVQDVTYNMIADDILNGAHPNPFEFKFDTDTFSWTQQNLTPEQINETNQLSTRFEKAIVYGAFETECIDPIDKGCNGNISRGSCKVSGDYNVPGVRAAGRRRRHRNHCKQSCWNILHKNYIEEATRIAPNCSGGEFESVQKAKKIGFSIVKTGGTPPPQQTNLDERTILKLEIKAVNEQNKVNKRIILLELNKLDTNFTTSLRAQKAAKTDLEAKYQPEYDKYNIILEQLVILMSTVIDKIQKLSVKKYTGKESSNYKQLVYYYNKIDNNRQQIDKIKKQYITLEQKSKHEEHWKEQAKKKYKSQLNIMISLIVFLIICIVIIFLLYFI